MVIQYLAINISIYSYIVVSTYGYCMGKINVVLPDDVEKRFRKAVFEKKGMKKGNISEALEEAVEIWMTTKK
jgi:hypothetical protein